MKNYGKKKADRKSAKKKIEDNKLLDEKMFKYSTAHIGPFAAFAEYTIIKLPKWIIFSDRVDSNLFSGRLETIYWVFHYKYNF